MQVPDSWEETSIDQLPQYHGQWIRRIIGLDKWEPPKRDTEKIESEYNQDKYGKLLDFYQSKNSVDIVDIRSKQLPDQNKEICVSRHTDLFTGTARDIRQKQEEWLVEEFKGILDESNTVIELGAGYGYNLHLLNKEHSECEYIGGEYTENGVELGNKLFADKPNISIKGFNFYNDYWDILRDRDDVVLVTKYGIQQLPEVKPIMESLISHLDSVNHVIHFEPVYGLYKDSLLGLIRKAYAHINDYNIDLYNELKKAREVEIVSVNHDQIGINPLTPTSVIHWKPTLRSSMN